METEKNVCESMIARLVAMGAEAAKGYKSKNAENFSLQELRRMAAHLKLTVSGRAKAVLVDNIISKMKYLEKGATLPDSDSDSEDSDEDDDDDDDEEVEEDHIVKFKKNKHTNFRLINLLFKYPVRLQQSNLISSKDQLQLHQSGAKNPLFVKVADEFNDDTDSGGLAHQHEEFAERKINPEAPHKGFITAKKCYSLWKDLLKRYAAAVKKFEVSGRGNELTFFNFCDGAVDILYLRLILNASNDVTLKQYCTEGSELEGGLETSVRTPMSTSTTSSRTSSAATSDRKRRRDEAATIMAEASQKKARALEEQVASEKEVNKELAMKAREEVAEALFERINKLGDEIDAMENSSEYDAAQPSARLLRFRAEFARLEAKHKRVTEEPETQELNFN